MQHKNRTAPKPYAARGCTVCTVFRERSALIEKIADECHLQEEDERYAEDELQMLCLMAEKLHGNKCACAAKTSSTISGTRQLCSLAKALSAP